MQNFTDSYSWPWQFFSLFKNEKWVKFRGQLKHTWLYSDGNMLTAFAKVTRRVIGCNTQGDPPNTAQTHYLNAYIIMHLIIQRSQYFFYPHLSSVYTLKFQRSSELSCLHDKYVNKTPPVTSITILVMILSLCRNEQIRTVSSFLHGKGRKSSIFRNLSNQTTESQSRMEM